MSGTTPTGESICIGCGLCCDGTLLSHVAVSDPSDLGWPLRALGVELIEAAEPPVFELPCPAVVEGRCTVFDRHRPHACALFECKLLRDTKQGVRSDEEARRAIGHAVRLRDEVRSGHADRTQLEALLNAYFREPN